MLKGGYIIDWHACDLFPKSWIDLVVVLRCPSTSVFYDRLSSRYAIPIYITLQSYKLSNSVLTQTCHHRGYAEQKLDENIDSEIFGLLLEEAKEAYDEEMVIELTSETSDEIESNCARIAAWVESWKKSHATEENSTDA